VCSLTTPALGVLPSTVFHPSLCGHRRSSVGVGVGALAVDRRSTVAFTMASASEDASSQNSQLSDGFPHSELSRSQFPHALLDMLGTAQLAYVLGSKLPMSPSPFVNSGVAVNSVSNYLSFHVSDSADPAPFVNGGLVVNTSHFCARLPPAACLRHPLPTRATRAIHPCVPRISVYWCVFIFARNVFTLAFVLTNVLTALLGTWPR